MPVPVVVYVDFKSAIDEKNKHKPIMLSGLAVSRIPTIHTQLQVFHAPHENQSDLRPFMDYLIKYKRAWRDIWSMNCHWRVHQSRERLSVYICVSILSHEMESDEISYYAHVAGEYSNGVEVKHYEDGQYIFTCCKKCNL